MKRPFADKVRELGLVGDELRLATDSGVDVVSIDAGSSEVVDVGANDDGVCSVEVGGPKIGALEVILDNERDAAVDLLNALQDALQVGVDPGGTFVGQTSSCAEADKVGVGGFVEG